MNPDGSMIMERGSGVALWRQIADRIRHELEGGTLAPNGRLPTEKALAERFGVNRHTVRGAIGSLVQEGVLRSEQGRGTFVEETRRISYALGRRTRFSANLEGQAREATARLIGWSGTTADARIGEALGLAAGAPVLRLDTLGEADGKPISRAVSWFDATRFDGLADSYLDAGSMTAALARHGVADYVRRSTVVSARHAEAGALAELALSPGAIVLVALSINDDMEGRPIQFSETLFAADRVDLSIA
jgi:GntR family phosphonate transport system transcriptional regulator